MPNTYGHKWFKFGDYRARCWCTDTRQGFCHHAELLNEKDYSTQSTARASYLNRTWEKFCYESVIKSAIYKLKLKNEREVLDQLDSIYGY